MMSNAKSQVRKLLNELPDNASFEDIQHMIYVRQKIDRGLADVDAGNDISQEEMEARVAQWAGDASGGRKRRTKTSKRSSTT